MNYVHTDNDNDDYDDNDNAGCIPNKPTRNRLKIQLKFKPDDEYYALEIVLLFPSFVAIELVCMVFVSFQCFDFMVILF